MKLIGVMELSAVRLRAGRPGGIDAGVGPTLTTAPTTGRYADVDYKKLMVRLT